MKDIKQIYCDHTGGWREKNPYSKNDVIYVPTRNASRYDCFELDIQYHDFPNAPSTKPGEVIEAYLQWQQRSKFEWCDKPEDFEWVESTGDRLSQLSMNYRQIWVAANQEGKDQDVLFGMHASSPMMEPKEEQAKDYCQHKDTCHYPICHCLEELKDKHLEKSKHVCLDCNYQSDDDPKFGVCPECGGCSYIERSIIKSHLASRMEQSPSATKVESAEEILSNIYNPDGKVHISVLQAMGAAPDFEPIIMAMKQYAALKTSSLQSLLEDKEKEVEKFEGTLKLLISVYKIDTNKLIEMLHSITSDNALNKKA